MISNFAGIDGHFLWFFGRVVDRNDPLALGRVRVRVFGIHPDDTSLVPNEHLPWAMPIQPITSAGQAGVGRSPTGMMEGTHVFGFFADGRDCQIPFILGTIAGGQGHFQSGQNSTSNPNNNVSGNDQNVANQNDPIAKLESSNSSAPFAGKAGPIGRQLMRDFGLTDYQAAGILGNFGRESRLIPNIKQATHQHPQITCGPCFPKGALAGYGWAQWTNPGRMDLFIDFVQKNFNVDITKDSATDEHNYAYFVHELNTISAYKTIIPALKKAQNIDQASEIFMDKYERPSPSSRASNLQKSKNFALQALQSINGSSVPMRSTAKNQNKGGSGLG